jgi:hypothetical protein
LIEKFEQFLRRATNAFRHRKTSHRSFVESAPLVAPPLSGQPLYSALVLPERSAKDGGAVFRLEVAARAIPIGMLQFKRKNPVFRIGDTWIDKGIIESALLCVRPCVFPSEQSGPQGISASRKSGDAIGRLRSTDNTAHEWRTPLPLERVAAKALKNRRFSPIP